MSVYDQLAKDMGQAEYDKAAVKAIDILFGDGPYEIVSPNVAKIINAIKSGAEQAMRDAENGKIE